MQKSCERIHRIIDEEAAKVGYENVFVGGLRHKIYQKSFSNTQNYFFSQHILYNGALGISQGCCTAIHVVLTYRHRIGGLLGIVGHLLTPTPLDDLDKSMPVRLFYGEDDDVMEWKWIKHTVDRFIQSGANVRHVLEPGQDHWPSLEQDWIRSFLNEVQTFFYLEVCFHAHVCIRKLQFVKINQVLPPFCQLGSMDGDNRDMGMSIASASKRKIPNSKGSEDNLRIQFQTAIRHDAAATSQQYGYYRKHQSGITGYPVDKSMQRIMSAMSDVESRQQEGRHTLETPNTTLESV